MTDWINYLKINDKYSDNEHQKSVLKFIFKWLDINEYYTQRYKGICGDKNKFLELKENPEVQDKYKQNAEEFLEEFEIINRNRRPNCYIKDMKNSNKKVYYHKQGKRRLEDLLKVIYQIRCNLFHGEKEPINHDLELISWAYNCLDKLKIIEE